MITSFRHGNNGLGPTLLLSCLFHIIFYGLFVWLHFLPTLRISDAPVYYVDMVNLPVAEPRAGSPAAVPAPLSEAASRSKPEMTQPAKKFAQQQPSAKTKPDAQKSTNDGSREFEEKLAHLEKSSEAKHEAAALEALRKRAATRSATRAMPAGIPGGTGHESGSDYAGYIRSRLIDAFRSTIAYQNKDPRVIVVLTIDRNGRVAKVRTERSSGDRMFDDSVNRAIARAEKEFKPPPGGGTFEYGFIFSPQGVGKQ